MENEATSLAPILDLDPELILGTGAAPIQVNDEATGFAVGEVVSRGYHWLTPRNRLRDPLTRDFLAAALASDSLRVASAVRVEPLPTDHRTLRRDNG
jgi:hypothetical protein